MSADPIEEKLEEVLAARVGPDAKELIGGPRDWVDQGAPVVGFVVGNLAGGLTAGIWTAVAVEAVVVAIRLLSRETLRHALSGAFGVVIAVAIAKYTGNAKNYFLPGIVINAAYAVGFLVSVIAGYPLVGVVMRLIGDRPEAWHSHPRVVRAYKVATLGWVLLFGSRFVVQEWLREAGHTGWLGVTRIAMGYPLFGLGLLATRSYVRSRTADVPLPEAAEEEPEAGGEDAAAEAAEGVGGGQGA